MKAIIASVLLSLTGACIAQDAVELSADKEELRSIVARVSNGDNEALIELSKLDPKVAVPALQKFALVNTSDVARTEKARAAIKAIPKIADYLSGRIQARIAAKALDHDVYHSFNTMALLKNPEAIRALGPLLLSDVILRSGMADVGDEPVSSLAAKALTDMNLPTAPIKSNVLGLTAADVESWRQWWIANRAAYER